MNTVYPITVYNYDSNKVYLPNTKVMYEHTIYECVSPAQRKESPLATPAKWMIVSCGATYNDIIDLQDKINNINEKAEAANDIGSSAKTESSEAISTANTARTDSANALTISAQAKDESAEAIVIARRANENSSNTIEIVKNIKSDSESSLAETKVAVSTANEAKESATEALTTANSALTIANSAKSLAENAFSKDGGTITGDLIINKSAPNFTLRHSGLTRGIAPTSAQAFGVHYQDKNGAELGYLYNLTNTDQSNITAIRVNGFKTTGYADLGVACTAAGVFYAYGPTPASDSNTTHLSTTAWVRTVIPTIAVKKTGDTMTGALAIQKSGTGHYVAKVTDLTVGTVPTANAYRTIFSTQDSTGKQSGCLQLTYETTNNLRFTIYTQRVVNGATKYSELGTGIKSDGTIYTLAPTPPAADNSTQIATTAWVRTFVSTASVTYATNAGNAYCAQRPTASGVANGGYVDMVLLYGNNGNRISTIRMTRHDTNGNSVLLGVHQAGTNNAPGGLTISMTTAGVITGALGGTLTVTAPPTTENSTKVPTTAWVRSLFITKTGNVGSLAINETTTALSNSQTITINSPDCINLTTSGAVTLTFTAAAATVRALKVLSITASATTTLTVKNAVWVHNGSAPTWGTAGKVLVLLAYFVGGRVVLSVFDNTQS